MTSCCHKATLSLVARCNGINLTQLIHNYYGIAGLNQNLKLICEMMLFMGSKRIFLRLNFSN